MFCTAQYSLGPPSFSADSSSVSATLAAMEAAIKDGSKWVLKPQREGGGNNLYGVELSDFLQKNKNDPILSGRAQEGKKIVIIIFIFFFTLL